VRGRSRQVKPELWKDETLWDLSVSLGLPGLVAHVFAGLWPYCDREGRFEWRPRALKSDILPYWDGDFELILNALASKSYIVRYTVNGRDYGYVRTFARHQSVHKNEAPSILPDPLAHGVELPILHSRESSSNSPSVPVSLGELLASSTSSSTSDPTSASASASGPFAPPALDPPPAPVAAPPPKPERKRPATRMPDDLAPNAGCRSLAHELGVSLGTEFPKFVDHHTAKGSTFSDWQAALRTWIRNSVRFGPPARAAPNDVLTRQAERVRMLQEQENQGVSP
jgi:hypothetical protein